VFASAEWHLWPEAGFRPGSAGRIRQLRAFPTVPRAQAPPLQGLKTTNPELALLLGRSDSHTKPGSARKDIFGLGACGRPAGQPA